MAALCLRAPNTNVGIKGQRRRPRSSQLALSLALSLSLSRSLSPLALSLPLSHTHTHSHTHTPRHRLEESARARHARTHTAKRKVPWSQDGPSLGFATAPSAKNGGRARGGGMGCFEFTPLLARSRGRKSFSHSWNEDQFIILLDSSRGKKGFLLTFFLLIKLHFVLYKNSSGFCHSENYCLTSSPEVCGGDSLPRTLPKRSNKNNENKKITYGEIRN